MARRARAEGGVRDNMPTGYTDYFLRDPNATFRDWAMVCARAFGACFMQRDEPLDAPPQPRPHDDYHDQALAKAKARLRELSTMSDKSARALWRAECERHRKENEKYRQDHERTAKRYAEMRAAAEAWKPPTPDHVGMKKFMLQQIDTCHSEWDGEPYQIENVKTAKAWLALQIESASHDVAYHTEKAAEELEREAESRRWLDALMDSIDAHGPKQAVRSRA